MLKQFIMRGEKPSSVPPLSTVVRVTEDELLEKGAHVPAKQLQTLPY